MVRILLHKSFGQHPGIATLIVPEFPSNVPQFPSFVQFWKQVTKPYNLQENLKDIAVFWKIAQATFYNDSPHAQYIW